MLEDEAAFISTPSLSGLIQQLTHLSQFGADALVVEGAKGSGKSSLLAHLAQQMQQGESREIPLSVSLFSAGADDEAFDSFSQLASSLGVNFESGSSGEIIAHLRSLAETLVREKRLSIVFIDDAHHLSDEALGGFLSLLQNAGDGSFGLKFIFFALPDFARRIDEVGLFDLAVYDFQMPLFGAAEIESVVNAHVADYAEKLEQGSAPDAMNLWNRSGGLPGLALSLLNDEAKISSPKNLADDVRKMPVLHLMVIAALLAGLILVLIYRGGDEGEVETTPSKRIIPESEVSAGPAKKDKATTSTIVDTQSSESISVSEDAERSVSQSRNIVSAENLVEPSRISGSEKVGNDIANTDLVSEESPEEMALESEQSIQNNSEIETAHLPSGSSAENTSELNVNSESVFTPTEEKPSLDANLLSGEKHLLAQSDNEYILQLLAASNREGLEDFVSRQENKDLLSLYRKKRDQNSTWYVVVAGPFPSKSEAQRAILNLPQSQRKSSPWLRAVSAIKKEIREYHNL